MFVSISLIAVVLLSLIGASQGYTSPSQANDKVRVLVEFTPNGKGAAQKALKNAGAEFHYEFDELNAFAVSLPSAALEGISHNPNVVLVEEDALRFPIGIMKSQESLSLPVQEVPYGVDMVQARDVWDADRNGAVDNGAVTASNRKICIIDSGFYSSHEDFQGISVAGYNGNLPWNQDGSGHGSHVAGTIAAVNNALGVLGVTPGTVQLYIVRVFGDDGAWAYSSSLIDAAYKCRDAGANIISMSLGGGRANNTEKNGFASLYNTYGILSIAAAGNDGVSTLSYPASYDSVVSVAAIDANKVVADFSQFNSQVELAAPGVGVLSTVPYQDSTSITVSGVTYSAGHVEFSARGSASGALVNGGLCDSVGSWSGKVVLCERGVISFYDKVINVQNGGGAAAVLYNNVPGGFLGTLGEGFSSNIVGISLSQEDGQYLVANKLGQSATVSSTYTAPASGYEYYDGTSMATPHASAVAALVWSADPTATNAEIRAVLQQTAQDLGTAGRDNYYGFGLIQAKDAIDALTGGGGGTDVVVHVADLDAIKTIAKSNWKVTVTIKVVDANGAAVSGIKVDGKVNTTNLSCTTGTNGQCSVTATLKSNVSTATYTVTNLSAAGYVYNAAANSDPDGDSTGTSIIVNK
ncbi:MAG: peptidase S8 [Chloroflexi bacterium HGW-Chloroflexi-6]|nr:MAG: peptidase S8 [Chloroflexi bacterium HGW-Chloroflexi-6]